MFALRSDRSLWFRQLAILWISLCLFIGYLCLYLFTSPANLPEGDELIMIGVADRIAHHGFSRLTPRERLARTIINKKIFSRYGYTDQMYSKYGVGQSLLDIPIVRSFRKARFALEDNSRVFHVLSVFSLAAFMGAVTNVLFFLTCVKLGFKKITCFLLTLLLGATTMIWPYTQTLFSDSTLGMLWLLAFFALLSYKTSRNKLWLVIVGLSIGFSFLTKVIALYTLPVFGLYLLYIIVNDHGSLLKTGSKTGNFRNVFIEGLWFIIPILICGIALLWYNNIRYGNLFAFGYFYGSYDVRDSRFGFSTPFYTGLFGLLLSPGKGFFFYSPSTILGLIGLKKFTKAHKAEALVIMGIISGLFLVYSKWWAWHGDFSWGPRFLSGLPPFFLLLCGNWLDDFIDGWQKEKYLCWLRTGLLITLFSVSFGVQILGLSIKSNEFLNTAANVGFFKDSFFNADWQVRDDSLQMHFIPEFSPLAGHIWLIRCIYYKNHDNFEEIYKTPPWRGLNPQWIPESPPSLNFNIWWLHARAIGLPDASRYVMQAFLLLAASIVCFGTGAYIVFKR